MRAQVYALVAIALGPWVAALWATGEMTQGGSSPWLRRLVKAVFWTCLAAAIVLSLIEP
jgi:hypothetical protein